MIDMERENLQVQAEQTEKILHILQCARQQDSVSEEKLSLIHICGTLYETTEEYNLLFRGYGL